MGMRKTYEVIFEIEAESEHAAIDKLAELLAVDVTVDYVMHDKITAHCDRIQEAINA